MYEVGRPLLPTGPTCRAARDLESIVGAAKTREVKVAESTRLDGNSFIVGKNRAKMLNKTVGNLSELHGGRLYIVP